MRELVLARHAESEFNVLERLNGDASVEVVLTEDGRAQARALGAEAGPVDLCRTHIVSADARDRGARAGRERRSSSSQSWTNSGSAGSRARAGRRVFEEWVLTSPPDEGAPGGGESRVDAVRRFVRGYRTLLARPEERIGAIAHGAPVRYVLLALAGKPPARVLEGVDLGRPFTIAAAELDRAVDVLETWAASPAF